MQLRRSLASFSSKQAIKIRVLTDEHLGDVDGESVDVVGEEVGAEEEAADGPEGAHGVHDADVHAAVVPLHVVVHVRRPKREERRAAATEQELKEERGRIRAGTEVTS